MCLSLFPAMAAPPRTRRPGRPVTAEIPAEREKHIQVALYRIAQRKTVAETAAAFDVSERTVYYWTDLALSYPDHRAVFLREMTERRSARERAS